MSDLEAHGQVTRDSYPRGGAERFSTWTLQPAGDPKEIILDRIQQDLAGKASILELFRQYMDELKANPDNNAVQISKMERLFQLGITPEKVEGHFYGVPVCLRTGDQEGDLASIGNVLEVVWGVTLDRQCPWVGKSFTPDRAGRIDAIAPGRYKQTEEAFCGINHFHKIDQKLLNSVSFYCLDFWMGLEIPPAEEQQQYAHDKNGGNFVAVKDLSVYDRTDREVFQLNYRWKQLYNRAPLCWLIDEIVQIAEGLYLGQLLFSTKRLLKDYDPEVPASDYGYQHFGYFLLFDSAWNIEARRLFPYLEIPVTAPGMIDPNAASLFSLPKFLTFTFEEQAHPSCDDEVLARIMTDLKDKPTIMHLIKEYSDQLQGGLDNESQYFRRLQEIFCRGMGIEDMHGHYRGALVSWHSEGMLKFFDVNMINLVWTSLARKFSTWTGKSFQEIPKARLIELTDGVETGEKPSRWGANTQSLRTFKQKLVGRLGNIAGIWTETVPAEEALAHGYDVKNFFFIARQTKSLNEKCREKTVYQFNYRWPKLKTIIPDRYCIDEIVQIADGLYLGQLMYATQILKPYDPAADPSTYRYASFGYFLLMDEEWHQIRLRTGFDLTNI